MEVAVTVVVMVAIVAIEVGGDGIEKLEPKLFSMLAVGALGEERMLVLQDQGRKGNIVIVFYSVGILKESM